MFATLFFGVLDPQSGVLTYINGGHEPPIILGPEGVKGRLEPTGPAVGMLPDMEFNLVEVTLAPGDTLLAFTDGITEARDGEGNFFGEERLLALIKDQGSSAKKLLSSISDEVQDYLGGTIQSDDITMLAVRHVFSTASERRPRSDKKVANLLDNL
jgi:serine phosphatase RsbU (regulator of sigma subunit)